MSYVAILTLLSLTGSALWHFSGAGSSLAAAHLAFAVGILPLILAAMLHFVPVLTRTGDPAAAMARIPFFAQGAGLLAVLAMQGSLPYAMVHVAAAADLILAGVVLSWMSGRARRCLGSPHPGWRWYAAALGCLLLALLAILASAWVPAAWRPLKLLHLHLNTLGLVGLAALGTLPVLLPTALGQPDPEAALWLRRRLWLLAGGAIVTSFGAAIFWPAAFPGAVLLLIGSLSLFGQWLRRFGRARLLGDGVAISLVAATLGMTLLVFAGVTHAGGWLPARPSLVAWGALFLLPLVSGALSQLLPVWFWPGPASPARHAMRRRMLVGAGGRVSCFILGGGCWLAGLAHWGAALIGLGLLGFVLAVAFAVLQAVRVTRSTR